MVCFTKVRPPGNLYIILSDICPRTDKNVEEEVKLLLSLPPMRELDLPETAGGPARRLRKKLGLEA